MVVYQAKRSRVIEHSSECRGKNDLNDLENEKKKNVYVHEPLSYSFYRQEVGREGLKPSGTNANSVP